jgi:hypothetical protein
MRTSRWARAVGCTGRGAHRCRGATPWGEPHPRLARDTETPELGEMSMLLRGGGSGHLDWGNALERMVADRNQTNAKTKEGEEMGKVDAGSP